MGAGTCPSGPGAATQPVRERMRYSARVSLRVAFATGVCTTGAGCARPRAPAVRTNSLVERRRSRAAPCGPQTAAR
jgi:hypothetical protein